MSFKLSFKLLKGEFWYGGIVPKGIHMPIGKNRVYKLDLTRVPTDQAAPFFVSNKGRYIWSEDGFSIRFFLGRVTCRSQTSEIILSEGHGTLRGAFLAASRLHFPPDGTMPHETMFRVPQYCTWIELKTNQTEEGILSYAKSILEAGMPAGEIIIDDGWQTDFGTWKFDPHKFQDAKKMVDQLHAMGFSVMLWICPFVSEGTAEFEELKAKDALVKDAEGNIAFRKWWNGMSAVLDMSAETARAWFDDLTRRLMQEYAIDGFKQDAGDSCFYKEDDINAGGVSPNEQCALWARSARAFSFNELRAGWRAGGLGVATRLGDKSHAWDKQNGLRSLIPNMLNLGITGHAFGCPDMIGGGLAGDFKDGNQYDLELFVRYAQCSALMPMMQYSLSLWRLQNKRTAELCQEATKMHLEFSGYIEELARHAAKTGEPIVRHMAYEFPEEGLECSEQQFMLGDRYLVAPMVWKSEPRRKVWLPKGKWKALHEGRIYEGGRAASIEVPLHVLPVFERLDDAV